MRRIRLAAQGARADGAPAAPERGERTLVVWCPDWPVVAAGVDPTAPAVVVEAGRVLACSPAARRAGVRRGLRRREAQARCPEVVVVEVDADRDARAFEPVVAAVAELSPRVEIVRPGVCALATRGPSRYFGGDAALVERVTAAVTATGVPCSAAVADGLFAATQAARRGAAVVEPGGSAAFLAPLGVDTIGQPDLADLLRRLGIRRLGDLAALPVGDLVARFGPDGERAWRLASGLDLRPLAPTDPPPDLVAVVELDPPADRVDVAAFAARGLAVDLHERLAALGLAATRIAIEAETEHGERLARVWRADGPLSAAAMAERVRWQLDGWLSGRAAGTERPTAGIVRLALVPDGVTADLGRQDGFWGGATAADDRAARAFARIQGLFGPEAVAVPVVVGGRHPATQAQLVPWGDERRRPAAAQAPWPGALPAPSPTVVPPEPLPAEVVDAGGTAVAVSGRLSVTAAPARVAIDGGRWREVVAWAGPWPVDERWWDPPAARRRARFQVVLDDGGAWLLALEGHRWHAEATWA